MMYIGIAQYIIWLKAKENVPSFDEIQTLFPLGFTGDGFMTRTEYDHFIRSYNENLRRMENRLRENGLLPEEARISA